MVLNGLIGAGIFAMPAAVADKAGGWAPLIVLLVGLAMLPVVWVFARLSALFEDTGGPILYVEAAFGRPAAFQIGWMQTLSTIAAAAANANALADYALHWWSPDSPLPIAHTVAVLAALALMFAINLASTGMVARALGLVSILKLLPLAMVLLAALPAIIASGSAPHPAAHWSLVQAVLLSTYAFTGFEAALTLAGEARDPHRDMPRAVIGVFVAVSLFYALLVWGYVATVYAPGTIDPAPLSTMAGMVIGGAGATLMLATATLSIFGNVANNMLITSRRLLALEALGGLPGWFGRIHAADGVPRNAVLFVMLALVGLALSGGFVVLAVLSVAARLIVYLGGIAALPVLEKRCGERGATATFIIVGPAAAICLALIAGSEARSWLSLAVSAAIGGLVYAATRAARARQAAPAT